MTLLAVAQDFTERRGWRVIPVPFRRKEPVLMGWSKLRLEGGELATHFNGRPSNIGVLLGEPSGWLVDVDLDCREAVQLAPVFLPKTHSRFGHASKRESHQLYIVTTAVKTEQLVDPDPLDGATGERKGMLVELRATGAQTVFPGSVHEGGEPIEWDEDGAQARGDGTTLRRAVAELAATCLLARHWPAPGQRHHAALAAAGLLVRGGFDEARAVLIVYHAALAAGDDEARARRQDVLTTIARITAGEPTTGGPTLASILRGDGTKVVATLRKWLGLSIPTPTPPAPERDAEVPLDEPLTDITNADRFVAQHGPLFRYVYAWNAWLHFETTRWKRDAGDVAIRCAKETARGWFAEAAQAASEDRRKALAKWAIYSSSEPGIRRMLALAQAELAITPDHLDADPWVLNCPNGTLELRTGHLRPHRREDFLTKLTAAPYAADARLPVWDSFLEGALPDDEARAFAQRYAGYCLTGSTREEVFVFCRGPAGAGKSTFTESLRRTWGDYATSADFTSFLAKRLGDGPREDIARLAGARLVTSVETRDGQRLAEGLVKVLTGGDTIPARRLYEQTFEFVPLFKLLLASNYRPQASAEDEGLWRRLRELPFPTARTKREDRDDTVKAALTDPVTAGPAILAWAVAGCTAWFTDGLGEPPAVRDATAEYRKSQEPLADFLAACCELGPDLTVPAGRLRGAYDRWCRTEGVTHPVGGRKWGEALRAIGCTADRHRDLGRFWTGIALREWVEAREPGED